MKVLSGLETLLTLFICWVLETLFVDSAWYHWQWYVVFISTLLIEFSAYVRGSHCAN